MIYQLTGQRRKAATAALLVMESRVFMRNQDFVSGSLLALTAAGLALLCSSLLAFAFI